MDSMDLAQALSAVPKTVAQVLLVAALLLGLMECFFGHRMFRIFLGLMGFILAGCFSWLLVSWATGGNRTLALLAALAGGAGGAVLLVVFHAVGIFLFGAQLGLILGLAAGSAAGWGVRPLYLMIPALLCGVIALLLRKPLVIAATAFGGAAVTVAATLMLIYGVESQLVGTSPRLLDNDVITSWLIVSAAGTFVQYGFGTSQTEEEEPGDQA